MDIKYQKPEEIEKRSMQIIESEMTTRPPRYHAPVIRRVIHTTADFEYENSLVFSETAVVSALAALRGGRKTMIVTDTNMALAGVNKGALKRLGCRAVCHMADADVAEEARRRGITRAAVSMEKAAKTAAGGETPEEGQSMMPEKLIFAVGNAPTALLRLKDLIEEGALKPALIIGVPVGFVNVEESKELIMTAGVPYIVALGRKGGSTVAAAICNALLYMAEDPSL